MLQNKRPHRCHKMKGHRDALQQTTTEMSDNKQPQRCHTTNRDVTQHIATEMSYNKWSHRCYAANSQAGETKQSNTCHTDVTQQTACRNVTQQTVHIDFT